MEDEFEEKMEDEFEEAATAAVDCQHQSIRLVAYNSKSSGTVLVKSQKYQAVLTVLYRYQHHYRFSTSAGTTLQEVHYYAHFWQFSCSRALAICSSDTLEKADLTCEEVSRIEACKAKIEKRSQKVKECGVFYLCEMLWLDPSAVSAATWTCIFSELKWFIEKQWEQWMRLRDVAQFPKRTLIK
jgi:hypothetical protein